MSAHVRVWCAVCEERSYFSAHDSLREYILEEPFARLRERLLHKQQQGGGKIELKFGERQFSKGTGDMEDSNLLEQFLNVAFSPFFSPIIRIPRPLQ